MAKQSMPRPGSVRVPGRGVRGKNRRLLRLNENSRVTTVNPSSQSTSTSTSTSGKGGKASGSTGSPTPR